MKNINVRERLRQLISFASATQYLADKLEKDICDGAYDSVVGDILAEVTSGVYQSTPKVIEENLNDLVRNLERASGKSFDGDNEVKMPLISVTGAAMIEVKAPINGGTLEAYVYPDGYTKGTYEAGVTYGPDSEGIIDLCMVKNNAEGNEDLSVLVWGDPTTEDYTQCLNIKKEDIRKAFV